MRAWRAAGRRRALAGRAAAVWWRPFNRLTGASNTPACCRALGPAAPTGARASPGWRAWRGSWRAAGPSLARAPRRPQLAWTGSSASPHPQPLEVLPLVAAHLARESWPAARLSCKQLEAALAPHVRSLSLARWPGGRGRQLRLRPGLACVATLEVPAPACEAELRVLQQLPVQLPALRHLRISLGEDDKDSFGFSLPAPVAASWASSSLAWLELPHSFLNVLPAVALPGLRVARLGGRVRAGDLAAFAPRLQQLLCQTLHLMATQWQGAALEALTHLGAGRVEVAGAGGVAGGMAALQRALPAVAVLVCVPVVCGSWRASWRPSLDDVLAALPGVTAARGCTATRLARVRASSLGRLQHLAVYDDVCDAPKQLLPALPHMQRLASLTLLCRPPSDSLAPLLQALAALPALASLVLPIHTLCEVCCPGVHVALPALVGSTTLVSLECVVALRDRPLLNCGHETNRAVGESTVSAAAAQRGVALQRLSLQREAEASWWAAPDFMRRVAHGDGGVWGAFGPADGQV